MRVDVIVTAGTPASLAVQKAATSIPLVMIAVGDPVATGLVASLGRPGGNITGLTSISSEMAGKRLELLREAGPQALRRRTLECGEPDTSDPTRERRGPQLRRWELKMLSLGYAAGKKSRSTHDNRQGAAGRTLVLADRLFLHRRTRIMDFAAQRRLPGVHAYRELVEAGGLMSYGPSYADMHRRAASYVDRILKGSKPADLPVQAPVQVRARHQSQGRQCTRPRHSAHAAWPRRRGDRVNHCNRARRLLRRVNPAPGTKRRWPRRPAYFSFLGSSGNAWIDGLGFFRRE